MGLLLEHTLVDGRVFQQLFCKAGAIEPALVLGLLNGADDVAAAVGAFRFDLLCRHLALSHGSRFSADQTLG